MTNRNTRWMLALLLYAVLALCEGAALADTTVEVSYVHRIWNGTAVVTETRTVEAVPVPSDGNMTSGWYYLNSNVTKNGLVSSITGDVNLILGDGYTLDVKGLYVPYGSTLAIYGQSEGTGKIYSHPGSSQGGAGVGGYSGHDNGNIVICGGTVESYGYDHCAGIGSNDGRTGGMISIYGGTITAKGGSDGAAIGGGRNCAGGRITIYGGTITANGPTDSDTCENGAGIGGGQNGSGDEITIYGGTIHTYSRDGAGIGGGDDGDGGTIVIHGGNITSTKVNQGQGARIGGGCDAAPGTITIHGGTITTVGGTGAGIGGGKGNTAGGNVTIDGGVISVTGSYGIGKGESGSDAAISLGYTDATKDSVSVFASSFGGTVTLEKPFAMHSYSRLFYSGAVPDNSLLADGALTYWNGEVLDWQMLQMAVNGAPVGTTISLGADCFASYTSDNALHIASGKNVTIDLKGHAINRNLADRDPEVYGNEGYVIRNEGTLTITDSVGGGAITGGNCIDNGGGIVNSGTLILKGGSITGNMAGESGGGVWNQAGGVFTMTGGSITGNQAQGTSGSGVGGGILNAGTLKISGKPVVCDNTAANGSNIYLLNNHLMTVTGVLTDGASLYVTPAGGTGVITSGYGTYNSTTDPESFFHPDNEAYSVTLDTGEACIDTLRNNVVYYRHGWNGTAVTTEKAYADKVRPVPADGRMTDGWYILGSDVTVDSRICLTGDTNLILSDGFTLDVKGIYIPQGSTLTIYSQTQTTFFNTGKIISNPTTGAGIGAYSGHPGGSIVIHGGFIQATGANHCAGIGSNDGNGTTSPITIYGGTITATGGSDGAGIGGGRDCDGGTITIYGGTITAKGGGENGAGIGGGDSGDGGKITIWGGTITANKDPNEDGAGIGGGDGGDGGNITINGGVITAYSRDGAGIGGGDDGDGGTITINGGKITCWDEGNAQGARIGGGCDGDGGIITISGGTIDVYFRDGAGIGGGEDGDSGIIRISGGTVTTHPQGQGNGAGIGGGNHSGDGKTITITGGTVNAYSSHGAGIGGGRGENLPYLFEDADPESGSGGTIVITGGTVTAVSDYGCGIGAGGQRGDTGLNDYIDGDMIGSTKSITIGGNAVVNAYGYLAGIGGDDGTINITGGTVTAGGNADKGSGSGIYQKRGQVNISGGTVTATGYGSSAGIDLASSKVTISGGHVTAEGKNGSGIGGRDDITFKNGSLTIQGENTVVYASSRHFYSIGGAKIKDNGDFVLIDDVKLLPGPTVEVDAGKGSATLFYEGCRITGGASKETAVVLRAEDRKTAHEQCVYTLIEPCDHDGTIEAGRCWVCGWMPGNHYATYELAEGEVASVEFIENGGSAPRPEDPTQAGEIFQGWYQVLEGGALAAEPYVFGTMLTEDITLRAVWIHRHDGITFEYWTSENSLPDSAGSYCLTKDVTLPGTWTWSGGTINLCLNGHTVMANQINAPVIRVTGGILNFYDEAGGTVTQVDGRDATVNVGSGGTINMRGGTITGATNAFAEPLAGVEVYGSFHMYGGAVTGNPKGVWVKGGAFTVSGSARVTGNAVNVLLSQNTRIQIGGALSSDALIGVSGMAGVFTNGLSGKGDASNFFSDDNHYVVILMEDGENAGEAMLEGAHTVTFEPGDEDAEGDMSRVKIAHNYLILPNCGYSVAGKTFKEWSVVVGDSEPVSKQPGSAIEITADTTATAVWEIAPFGTPDFVIPAGVTAIEANAFEGIAATVIQIPANCGSIGEYAFKDCAHLTQIRIPAGCVLGADVFDGCAKVYVFGMTGSPAEAYCLSHSNCVFMVEGQN